jgi:hypothetical protein
MVAQESVESAVRQPDVCDGSDWAFNKNKIRSLEILSADKKKVLLFHYLHPSGIGELTGIGVI